MEVEAQILLAFELGFGTQRERQITGLYLLGSTAEVGKILNSLLNSLPSRR